MSDLKHKCSRIQLGLPFNIFFYLFIFAYERKEKNKHHKETIYINYEISSIKPGKSNEHEKSTQEIYIPWFVNKSNKSLDLNLFNEILVMIKEKWQ